jgi:probable hydrolase protein
VIAGNHTHAPVLVHETQGRGLMTVFIHGYISDLRIWAGTRAAWRAPGRLVFPTLGGFGAASPALDPDFFGVGPHMEQLATLIESVSVRPVHLVGWSYGASLALLLAASRPELVASVYSYEAGLSDFITDPGVARQVQDDRADMVGPALAAVADGNLDLAVRHVVDKACARDGVFMGLDPAMRRVFLDNAKSVPLMFAGQSTPGTDAHAASIHGIRCPVTLSTGSLARPAYSLVADQAAIANPNGRRETIPGALHVAPVTNPAAFVTSVAAHLRTATTKGI